MSGPAGASPPLPDAVARELIAGDLDGNFLVEAGAGSGKTTELVRRMVALVETGAASVDELAAVTFTRKAAAELRERFQSRLEERLSEVLHDGADDLAAERLAMGLDDLDRAFIGTIHSFCARLLRERPLEIGIDPSFEELAPEERIALRRRFWDGYLERLTRDSAPILEELAVAGLRPVALFGLFDRIVENPDVEFRTEAVEPGSTREMEAARHELGALVDMAWQLMSETEPPRGWDSLQRKMRTLHHTRDATGWTRPADFYEALARVSKPGPNGHQIVQNRWKDAPLAVAFRDRVNAFSVGDTPARRLLARWRAHRYALAVRLVWQAAEDFGAHRQRIGRLDFQDLLVLTADLLRSRPEVRSDLGLRYRRLFVDEFQDTDPLQAEIMLLLSSDPGSEERSDWRSVTPRPGALFVVGDPKQSIYRFRRADIQMYGVVKDRFRAFGNVLELTTNFRSRPLVGDLVNALFREAGFFPTRETAEQAAFEPLNTRPPAGPASCEGVFTYDVAPENSTRLAAATDDAARIATWIRERVEGGERTAGDFLILTRLKGHLDVYAAALEAHRIPAQVTGAGVAVEDELRELQAVLECLIDPTNPVKVVTVLVGLFFGLDYERLIEHRLDGGAFDAMALSARGHADVRGALGTIHRWWRTSSREPADVVVGRLAGELGLLPYAAAGRLGSQRAGALAYALDAVRGSALGGDASLPGALAAMRAALDLSDAEAPLEPCRTDVVRLMNLHQAKGLEAPVVILSDPSRGKGHPPDLHVTRSSDGHAVGYLSVVGPRRSFGGGELLAAPAGWDEKEATERRFETAEEVRLLYVAVTRAKEELVVSRWPGGPGTSPWKALDPWLDQHATPLDLQIKPPPRREALDLPAEEMRQRIADAHGRLAALSAPSYSHAAVTRLAKESDGTAPTPTTDMEATAGSDGFRGFSWGSAVHGALAAAASGPEAETLRVTCRDLLVQAGRPVDDHGDPVELPELLNLVRTVLDSELWRRAQRADRVLAEVPFSVPGLGTEAGEGGRASSLGREVEGSGGGARKQLDLFSEDGLLEKSTNAGSEAEAGGSVPHVLEGVIDLVFREAEGWVVADYKTDLGSDPDFAQREPSYRLQVDMYAEAWTRLTGEPVKERVLFYTAQGRVDRW